MEIKDIINFLASYDREIKIMEVCGSHTSSIVKNGIRGIISDKIRLVSGPGCPACVTGAAYIHEVIKYAMEPGVCVLCFGDLFKLSGGGRARDAESGISYNVENYDLSDTGSSIKPRDAEGGMPCKGHNNIEFEKNYPLNLTEANAAGGRAQLIYSPLGALDYASKEPETQFVVAAIGFETTIPLYAVLIKEIISRNISNIKLITALKTMIAPLDFICQNEAVDGFLCPGHVSVVIGSSSYAPLCEKYKKPFVIAGFEAEHILAAIYEIIWQRDIAEKHKNEAVNLYKSVVTNPGNTRAQALINTFFEPSDAYWRGIGVIKNSGLTLRKEFSYLDAGSGADILPGREDPACRCADIMLGRAWPSDCPLFGKACTPANPVGACIVTSEGPCGIWYENGESL